MGPGECAVKPAELGPAAGDERCQDPCAWEGEQAPMSLEAPVLSARDASHLQIAAGC